MQAWRPEGVVMAWRYEIHDGKNTIVKSEGGFPTSDVAQAAGWDEATRMAASPDNQQPGPPIYSVTVSQEKSSPR